MFDGGSRMSHPNGQDGGVNNEMLSDVTASETWIGTPSAPAKSCVFLDEWESLRQR